VDRLVSTTSDHAPPVSFHPNACGITAFESHHVEESRCFVQSIAVAVANSDQDS